MSGATILAVLVSGALGACIRFALGAFFARRVRGARVFPWGVFVVNVVASFIAGLATGLAASAGLDARMQVLLVTGIAGGLSTFSTFSVDTIVLVKEKEYRAASVVVLANLLAGLAAVAAGLLVGRLP